VINSSEKCTYLHHVQVVALQDHVSAKLETSQHASSIIKTVNSRELKHNAYRTARPFILSSREIMLPQTRKQWMHIERTQRVSLHGKASFTRLF